MNCGISYVQMREGGGINMMRKRLWKITIMNTIEKDDVPKSMHIK